jgi:sugar phosphate isomerase/epimerase
MMLGISGQALGGTKTFAEIVRIGVSHGIYDYEIWPVNAPGDGWGYSERDVASVKQAAEREGARIGCVTVNDAFDPAIHSNPDAYIRALCSGIETAKLLGASCVNHYCCHISRNELDFALMERFWTKPLALAEDLKVTLVLENEAHDSTSTPEKMLAVLHNFQSAYFKTNFDATNYFHASCEGYPGAYDLLREYIAYVHIKNGCLYREGLPPQNTGSPMTGYNAPARIQYTSLQDGTVNIPGLLARLEEDGIYNGLCTLEPHTKPEYVEAFYAREIAYLRKTGFFNGEGVSYACRNC